MALETGWNELGRNGDVEVLDGVEVFTAILRWKGFLTHCRSLNIAYLAIRVPSRQNREI
jgi:hypothetical protein